MFGGLFKPSHEKQCLKVLQIFGAELESELAWQEIQGKVARVIRDQSKDIERRIVFDGDRPKDVVGDIIASICLTDIELGHEHIYRRRLGMTGQSKRNIFAAIVTQQFADGWIDAQQLGIANENMKQAVAGAG